MASIDYEQAKEQLEKMFQEPSDHRKVIFWYDAPKNFSENVKEDTFSDAKVIIYENNPFTIKTRLDVDDPDTNYLIYYPYEKPKDAENWLADVTFYSKEYYADTVALTMGKLKLTNHSLRSVIEQHIHFFDSQDRTNALVKMVTLSDEMPPLDLELGMMSVLVKNPGYNKIDYVAREIIFDDLSGGEKYKALLKFGFREDFWDLIGKQFSYSGTEDIKTLRQTFLLTAMAKRLTFDVQPGPLKSLILKTDTENIEIFADQMLKSDERYLDLDRTVWNELKIGELISTKGIEAVGSCDVFEEFDGFVIKSIIAALAGGSYDYDSYLKVVNENRINSKWFALHKAEYSYILALIAFFKSLSVSIEEGKDSESYIHAYAKSYWKIDNAYRHALVAYSQIEEPTDDESTLAERVDGDYETRYLDKLGPAFAKSLKAKEPDYSFGSVRRSLDFYSKLDHKAKKQFVIISDALRYEVAEDLVKALNQKENFKGKASLNYQTTTLPSVTMLGMAALLPNHGLSYQNKAVFINGKPTDSTAKRDAILKSYDPSYAAIQYEEITAMNKDRLRAYMRDKSLVYIYHDVIDNAGEHNEPYVFKSCDRAIEEIVALINKLYNALQISNFLVTSDHGFIYRNKKIEESSKYKSISCLRFDDYSARYVIVDDDTKLDFTNRFSMGYLGDCHANIILPYGYDLFKKPGGGIQYIHGGAMPQEIVTPIVSLSDMRARNNNNLVEPVKVRLKSTTRKIMSKSFSLSFEQMERVGGKKKEAVVLAYFVDGDQNVISDEKTFIANKTTDNLDQRTIEMRFLLKNQSYDRNKPYYLVLKNAETGEFLEQPIRFVVDIIGFKMF